jgi:hypothetical protein
MKKFILLVSILFTLTSQAQPKDLNTICIPTDIAQRVVEDLVICDSTKAMLFFTKKELQLTKEKLSYKDSIILTLRLKEANLESMVSIEEEQKNEYINLYKKSKNEYGSLASENKKIKVKHKIISAVWVVTLGVLTYLYIIK